MWPLLLDMTKEECSQNLRCLELEAYASLVSALRAQGPLNSEKLKLLKETGTLLNISQERHKAEIRRVVNDEKLNTIAYHICGQRSTSEEWSQEGRRLIPLMPRIAPQTAYSAIADEVADSTNKSNKQLPLPSSTERKRSIPVSAQSAIDLGGKPLFRVPEPPKIDEIKKKKFSLGVENSSLAQHLMGPPKISRIQQIYRQKTKARQKEFQLKLKNEIDKQELPVQSLQKFQQKPSLSLQSPTNKSPKINILQNVSLQSGDSETEEVSLSQAGTEKQKFVQATQNKVTQHITLKQIATAAPGSSGEMHKKIKVCTTSRKPVTTKTVTTCTGQKLIVVSNPQCVTTSSILQRTLTIPFVKNISVKNIDKFKIVTSSANTAVQLTPLSNAATFTTNSKHKVVTVKTNPGVKKVIPFSQLQVLNAKGGIKVLPFGSKIVTKANNSTSPIYIVNSSTNMQALTKSTPSTPIVMSSKTQDSVPQHKEIDEDFPLNNETCEENPGRIPSEDASSGTSAIISTDAEVFTDFESQIMQHTIQQLEETQDDYEDDIPYHDENLKTNSLKSEYEIETYFHVDKPLRNELVKETESIEYESVTEPLNSAAIHEDVVTLEKTIITNETQRFGSIKKEEMSDLNV